jgi:hypothetical protein
VDPGRRTFDFEVATDGGERVRQQTGLSWRSAGLKALRTVCLETAAATPRQDLDLDSIVVTALPD